MTFAMLQGLLDTLPLLALIAMGAVLCERSGVSALGVEGMAAIGAAMGIIGASLVGADGSQPQVVTVGFCVLVAAFGGAVLAAGQAWLSLHMRVPTMVSAILINLLAIPLARLLVTWRFGDPQSPPTDIRLGALDLPPWVVPVGLLVMFIYVLYWLQRSGKRPSALPFMAALVLLILGILGWARPLSLPAGNLLWLLLAVPVCFTLADQGNDRLSKAAATPLGGLLRVGSGISAAGHHEREALVAGIPVVRYRWGSLLTCGVLCGVAGSTLALGQVDQFQKSGVGGYGYIALAAVVAGGWRAVPALSCCVLFALLPHLQIFGQAIVEPELSMAIPFLIVAVFVLTGKAPAAPSSLLEHRAQLGSEARLSLGLILATGERQDGSVNQHVAAGVPRWFKDVGVLTGGPETPGPSVDGIGKVAAALKSRHSHLLAIGRFASAQLRNHLADSVWPRAAVIDGEGGPPRIRRVQNIRFNEARIACPAGYVAAVAAVRLAQLAAVRRPAVLFMGACPGGANDRWADGFYSGVNAWQHDNPNVRSDLHVVERQFVSGTYDGFHDPVRGALLASYLFRTHPLLVVMQAAGSTSHGILEAAKAAAQYGSLAFVISADCYDRKSGAVLFSVIRPVQYALLDWIGGEVLLERSGWSNAERWTQESATVGTAWSLLEKGSVGFKKTWESAVAATLTDAAKGQALWTID